MWGVEGDLLHALVRGEDIDPFQFTWSSYIIFTHDPRTLEPLWDPDQKVVLDTLGLLRRDVNYRAAGSSIVYRGERLSVKAPQGGNCVQSALNKVNNIFNILSRQGFTIQPMTPCVVNVGC